MDNCELSNSVLNNLVFATKDRKLTITKSKLVDTIVKVGNINTPGFPATIILENCNLFVNTIGNLFSTDFNQPSGLIKLKNCNVEISNPLFSFLIKHEKTIIPPVFTLILKDCNFKYTGGATPLKLTYYNSIRPMIRFISADNVFTNMTLPAPDAGIYFDYDIEREYKQSITLQPDGNAYTSTISHNLNTLEPYIFCVSSSTIINPVITIIDANSILVKHTQQINMDITVKKI
ncbi:hypothetical protein V7068_22260 [Bacillus sp. JJ634]